MKGWNQSLCRIAACAALVMSLISCGGSGSGGGGTTPPAPPAGTVTLTGTVSGTIIKVVRADTGAVISQTDTASLPGPPPFPFSLSNIPVGVAVKAFFFSAGQTFPLYIGNTNVFSAQTAGSISLGFVTMSGGRATPQNQVSSVSFGPEDPSIPPGVEPQPATLTVMTPAPATGSVIVNFSVQDFPIGGEGQQHLHIRVDGGPTRHFFNGSSQTVVDDGGNPTGDVEWESNNSFRLNSLSVGNHQVVVKLATASDGEFVNREANPPAITVSITPGNPAILTITNPMAGAPPSPFGQPVAVLFTVQNFTIGGQGSPHMHISVDGGPPAHFYNGTTNHILDGNGQPVSNMTRTSATSFEISGLSGGSHQVDLGLVDASDQPLLNAEANPAPRSFSIEAPPVPTVVVTSGTSFLSSPVRISFDVQNFTIGSPGNPHMRFTIDNGPSNDFYIGTSNDPDIGVQRNGQHTHFAHWISETSFDLFSLSAGQHSVRLALVDAFNNELPNNEAKTTHNFTVQQPPSGDLSLQSVLNGLNFPSALVQAPDSRVFFNELGTGDIRVVNFGTTWNVDPAPFCSVSLDIQGGEQGLLGLALDPSFSPSNQVLYVYYTASGPSNRVSRLTKESNGTCTETPILTGLPTSANHNGGIIKFGPDGKLYVIIGDAENPFNARDPDSLAGKILRVNSDGSAPPDNPFYVNGAGNRDRVYSLGHRNSFGFTFHPQTGDLWESENGPNSPEFDEVNHVTRGSDYGWDSSEQSGCRNSPPLIDPIVQFSIFAPTGIVAIPANSAIYPSAYQNNLLVAGFNDGTIRLVIANPAAQCGFGNTTVAYPGNVGGLISLMLGSDGYVYVSSTNGVIYRVIPH